MDSLKVMSDDIRALLPCHFPFHAKWNEIKGYKVVD